MQHTLSSRRYTSLIAFAIAALVGSSSFGQEGYESVGGGFGGGLSGTPMKIVIMLGPEFDFKSKPFTDAPTILKEITNIEIQGFFPKFETIEIDVETPIPKGDEVDVTVIATYPAVSTEAEIAKIKRTVQLIALRFSINHVEMIASDSELADEATAIWLRMPYHHVSDQEPFAKASDSINRYAVVAKSIAELYEPTAPSTRARIDVYQAQSSEHHDDPFGNSIIGGPTTSDPITVKSDDSFMAPARSRVDGDFFGGPATSDPMTAKSDDLFGAPADSQANSDPFGGPTTRDPTTANSDDPFAAPPQANRPPQGELQRQTDESISNVIARLRMERIRTQSEIRQITMQPKNRQYVGRALDKIAQDLRVESELQTLQIQQLENKVLQLRQSLEQRIQPTEKRAIIISRYEKLFGKLPTSLNPSK